MMKYPYIFILLCLTATTARSQEDSLHVWNKWCARKDSLVLFATANNMIQMCRPGYPAGDIKLKSMDNALRIGTPEIKGDTLSVMAMPHAAAGKKMRLAVTDKKTGKTIKTITFYSDTVPAPCARLGNLKTAEASRKDILSQMALRVVFPSSLYSYPYRIKQYTFHIQSAKGSATIPVAGFSLTKEVLEEIRNAPAGTEATFTNIVATCPECSTRQLEDLKIKIK